MNNIINSRFAKQVLFYSTIVTEYWGKRLIEQHAQAHVKDDVSEAKVLFNQTKNHTRC